MFVVLLLLVGLVVLLLNSVALSFFLFYVVFISCVYCLCLLFIVCLLRDCLVVMFGVCLFVCCGCLFVLI